MSRTALARRYRPRRFEELVGQDHVSSTLRSAVEGGRVGHAYLFCGPRGVGKTTAARVLAMALNCPDREEGEPCGACASCERIWSGQTSLDVVEIDAASNRGVDDARDLRERAMYAPSDDERYKVYIVDEAHMLTREAWNALLKILEEPPPRVIFAFATTEPQRIQRTAAPVMSRCQRFDFRRVSVPEIVGRLETVLEGEGVEAEEGALLPIARQAEGGVRDALSLLDQVLSFSADRVRTEDVRRMLGLVEEERFLEFFDLAARGARAEVFPFVQRLVDQGHDPAEFVQGLADALRVLLVLRMEPDSEAVELMPESRERFREASQRFEPVDLLRLLMAVSDFATSDRFRRSARQRIQLELLLMKLVSMDSAVELEELLRAAGGAVPETGRRGGGEGGGAPGGSGSGQDASGGAGAPSGPGRGAGDGGGRTARASPSGGGTSPEASAGGASPRASSPGPGPEASTAGPGGSGSPRATAVRDEPSAADPAGAEDLQEAWRRAVSRAEGLGGRGVVLGRAEVRAPEEGEVLLRVEPGLVEDLREFLTRGGRAAGLREELAPALSLDPGELAFRVEPRSGDTERMTSQKAREARLEDMMEMDPTLREAVEKLDLTFKE